MSKKYEKPPLVEVACEFRLTHETPWDLTVPGLIYEKVSDRFKIKEQRLAQEVTITQGGQAVTQGIRTSERILFFSEDRKAFVQIGPHLVSVNHLQPYPHWENYKPSIETAYKALKNTVDIKGFQRIGLRYINHIKGVPAANKLEEIFQLRPQIGAAFDGEPREFQLGCLWTFKDGTDGCRVELATAASDVPGTRGFLLDLDYFLSKPQGFEPDRAMEWVEQAHTNLEAIFEGCITPILRDTFQEIK